MCCPSTNNVKKPDSSSIVLFLPSGGLHYTKLCDTLEAMVTTKKVKWFIKRHYSIPNVILYIIECPRTKKLFSTFLMVCPNGTGSTKDNNTTLKKVILSTLGHVIQYPLFDCCLRKNQNAPGRYEHPPVKGENVKTFRWDHNRLQIQNVVSHIQRIGCQLEK